MQDDHFRKWVLSGDEEANAYWTEFLTRYPEKQPMILSARAVLNALKQVQAVPGEEQGARMWENIVARGESETDWVEGVDNQLNVYPVWRWLSAACVALLCCSLGWYWFSQKTPKVAVTYSGQVKQVTAALIEKVNATPKKQLITLPDGSTVELAANSRVSYNNAFAGDKREVYLSGEGFFNVVKNKDKPFFVYANRIVTQVVGTRFTVTSSAEYARASVVVKSGKVKVYTLESFQKMTNGLSEKAVVLTPNMQVIYDPIQNVLSKSLVAEPAIINAPTEYPDFSFEKTSVSKVFETLENSYGVSITYDAKTIENCDLTAPLGDEPLFRKLDIICQTIDATYQVWETQIVVSGKGCTTE